MTEIIPAPEPDAEPKGMAALREGWENGIYQSGRMLGITGKKLGDFVKEQGLTAVAVPAVLVAALGAVEGGLLSNWDPSFMAAYGGSKLLSAPIWVKDVPQAVATVAGVGAEVIRNFNAEVAVGLITQAQADTLTFVTDKLYQAGSIIAGGTIFLHVTNAVLTLNQARADLLASVLGGKESLWKKGEQVFFVGGQQSGVLDARMTRTPRHTIPILEKTEGAKAFMQNASKRGKIPTYSLVEGEDYGSWEGIGFKPEWLISTPNGRKLIVVGDGSVYEEALDLGQEPKMDVTVKELQVVTDRLTEDAKTVGVELKKGDVVRMYLGNARREITTGGGYTMSLREHVDRYGSVEVFIDTRSPLVERVLVWLGDKKAVVFDTTNVEYFSTVKDLLSERGVKVFDQNEDFPSGTPRIVYEDVTATTVKRAQEIIDASEAESKDVVALTDTKDGHEYATRGGIPDICSALVYDAEINNVVRLLKKGKKPEEIQQWLDERWGHPGIKKQTAEEVRQGN